MSHVSSPSMNTSRIKATKSKMISKYGTDVTLKKYASGVFTATPTKAMLGRGTRSIIQMREFDNVKEGIFLTDTQIKSGDYVEHPTSGEMFIVGGTHNEYDRDSIISIVTNLLTCNTSLTLQGQRSVADSRGNLKSEFVNILSDLPCYVQVVTDQLRQFDMGLLPDTVYKVFATAIDVAEIDKVVLNVRGKQEQFRVNAKDYTTFPDLVVIQVARDIRK